VRQSELKLKLILENIGGIVVQNKNCPQIIYGRRDYRYKKDAEMPTTLDWSAKYSLYYPDEKTVSFKTFL
jgi:hypothetical protein